MLLVVRSKKDDDERLSRRQIYLSESAAGKATFFAAATAGVEYKVRHPKTTPKVFELAIQF